MKPTRFEHASCHKIRCVLYVEPVLPGGLQRIPVLLQHQREQTLGSLSRVSESSVDKSVGPGGNQPTK